MAHHHEHHHHHSPTLTNLNKAFCIGILLNSAFVLIEFGAGFYYNSLALLSDAGHNLSDVAALALSLFAFKMAQSKSTERFTYGYHKSTILASLTNAVILFIAVGSIGWEAVQRFTHPVPTNGVVVSIVAAIGIGINSITAFLFFKDRHSDLNVKGAYLHMATDALVSLGVVMAGVAISYTGIFWIDPLVSLVIMAVVIYSAWGLLMESLRLSLDGVPESVDVEKIKQAATKLSGVNDLHHIHIWAMSTTKNAMTAHLVVDKTVSLTDAEKIKHDLKHELSHLNVQHVTLEIEMQGEACEGCG